MKECTRCATTKDLSHFYTDGSKKSKVSTYCKPCSMSKSSSNYHGNRLEKQKYLREYYLQNKDKAKEKSREYLYGLSKIDYENMCEKQLFSCLICGEHEKELKRGLFVDHCHETGKVRGLLCQSCNTLLGMAKDNTEVLQRAIQYLNK